jgi:hypothetical protein
MLKKFGFEKIPKSEISLRREFFTGIYLVSNVLNPYTLDGITILPWRDFLFKYLDPILMMNQ